MTADAEPPRGDAGRLVLLVVAALVATVALLVFVSTTRLRQFTPDSMNYVDVARNAAAGRGLVQSSVGLEQQGGIVEVPLTNQPPLYPLGIAALSLAGVPEPEGALVLPCLAYGAALAAAFLLGRELFGAGAGFAAMAALALCRPVRLAAMTAWSDLPALALALLALALAARARRTGGWTVAGLAGLACGFAFATRYAYSPLAPLAALVLVDRADWRRSVRPVAAFGAACAAVVAAVTLRNHAADGTWLGPARAPSGVGAAENTVAVMRTLFGAILSDRIPAAVQAVVALAAVAAVAVAVRRAAPERLLAPLSRVAPALWAAVYVAFIVAARTKSHFDPIDLRLVLPAAAFLVAWTAAVLARGFGLSPRHGALLALGALAVGAVPPLLDALRLPARSTADEIAASPRLAWIAANVGEGDYVLGDDTGYVPYFFPGRHAASFSPGLYTAQPTYDGLMRFARGRAPRFRRFFIVLTNRFPTRAECEAAYGPFVADLAFAETPPYAGITRVARTGEDGCVLALVP